MRVSAIPTLCGVALLIASTAASALPIRSFERAELFATCAGRMSALATRQRSFNEDGAETSERLRQEFDNLLEAVLPMALDDGVPEELPNRWRFRGWSEIAGLLADADYSLDAGLAERAEQAMNERIASCRNVIL